MATSALDVTPHTVRVSVSIPGLNVDVPLPSNIPVDLVIADLIPFLRQTLTSQRVSTKWIDQSVRWKLTTRFGYRLAPTKTLDEQGVLHGDLILVEIEKTAEQFTPLIDDIADAVSSIQRRVYPDYSPIHSIKLISYALITFAFLTSLIFGFYGQYHRGTLSQWTPSALIILGAVVLLTAWIIDKRNTINKKREEETYPEIITTSLILSSFFWIFAGTLTVIPRPFSAAQVLTASVTILAVSSISARITGEHSLLQGSIIVLSFIIAVSAGLQVGAPQHIGTLGTELILLAVVVIFFTTKLSLSIAGISLPPTPSPGEDHVKDNAIIAVGDLINSDTKLDGILPTIAADEEARAIRQYVLSNSFLLGAVIAITIGSYISADPSAPYFWFIITYILVIATILLFRGKSYSDLLNRSIMYIGALSTIIAAWIHLALEEKDPLYLIYFSAPVVCIVFAFFIGVVQGRTLDSPIARQRLEMIERILYASIFPLVTIISGLYFKVRYHS